MTDHPHIEPTAKEAFFAHVDAFVQTREEVGRTIDDVEMAHHLCVIGSSAHVSEGVAVVLAMLVSELAARMDEASWAATQQHLSRIAAAAAQPAGDA